jgi:hypothetical protein
MDNLGAWSRWQLALAGAGFYVTGWTRRAIERFMERGFSTRAPHYTEGAW